VKPFLPALLRSSYVKASRRVCEITYGKENILLYFIPIFKLMKSLFFSFSLLAILSSSAQPSPHFKVIAYCTGNADTIVKYPIQKLTHIIYSFLKISNDTLCFRDSAQQSGLQKLVALKQEYPKLKVMVSIGGWSGCAPCSDLFADETHRNNFARTTVALFRQYGIDGLDIDWEYPAIEGFPGHKYDTTDREHFTQLISALRKEMGKKYLLSFAAGAFTSYQEHSIEWAKVMPQVDFVNLMTYDLVGGYATVTGHHTPMLSCRAGQECADNCVTWLMDKHIPAKKLILGSATYARVWENVPDSAHGLYQPGKFLRGVSYFDFDKYFCDTSGYCYYWDPLVKAPYRYNKEKHLFATFDDEQSVKQKCLYIRKKKLGGIMFWQLNEDKKVDGLLGVMSRELNE
jgi:chitinase